MRAIKTTTISILTVGMVAGSVGTSAQGSGLDQEPAYFSGTYHGDGLIEFIGEASASRTTFVKEFIVDVHDPRLSGAMTMVSSRNFAGDDRELTVFSEALRLANDGGGWSGTGSSFVATAPDEPAGLEIIGWAVLDGEGAYDGLSAILHTDIGGAIQGIVLPTDLIPPVPDPLAAQ